MTGEQHTILTLVLEHFGVPKGEKAHHAAYGVYQAVEHMVKENRGEV